jgi:gamma-glutamyltranspeptidase/glutathione hydrolase
VIEGGGMVSREDLAAYETIAREPVRASFRGHEILTNPPPSSGGVLIALALELLERAGSCDVETLVGVMEQAQEARTPDFLSGLYEDGFERRFLADRLGSTTHITAVDALGGCASVTCSNGSGSGVFVPGTGLQINNMLGEQDLNPFGFHATAPGCRLPSMMSPSVVLRDGNLQLGLGSGGSNRIRSAITQTIVRCLADGLAIEEAVVAPRVHFEAGVVHSEPGIDEAALDDLAASGYEVIRWRRPNLFFGGVHAVAIDADGSPRGAGDPRRGGAVAMA